MLSPTRAERVAGTACRFLLGAGARKRGGSRVRKERRELALWKRLVQPSELDRNVVETAAGEAPIEVPQAWNDHSRDRNADVGARLVENEEIEALSHRCVHACVHLLARIVQRTEAHRRPWLDRCVAAR